MLGADEIRRSLAAAWGLLRGDPGAMAGFDTSFVGFWRSFLAIVLLIPVYVPYVLGERRLIAAEDPEAVAGVAAFFVVRTLGLVVDWVAFPAVMALLARPLGLSARYPAYITAYNWTGVIAALFLAVPAILFGWGAIGPGAASLLTLVGLVLVLRYRYLVARIALDCSAGLAGGLVALDFVLALVLAELFGRLAGF